MKTEFIDEKIWTRLRQMARKCRRPAAIAVAYFSRGAAKLLPLRKGSRLVVDASEATVKAGLTCPNDLLQLQKQGVRIFSVQNLHAKVYVFGSQAFIGSSNASRHSANRLKEAVLRTTEREAVKAARTFVRQMCLEELGPEALEGLKMLYRPPKFPGGKRRRRQSSKSGAVRAQYSGLRLANLIVSDYPQGSESTYDEGWRIAESKCKHKKTHSVDGFRWHNNSIKPNETVVQIVDEGDGPSFVSPPGRVTNTKNWSNGRQKCTFVYLEIPEQRRIRVNKLAKQLGRGAFKRLKRSGMVSSDFADKLREAWRR